MLTRKQPAEESGRARVADFNREAIQNVPNREPNGLAGGKRDQFTFRDWMARFIDANEWKSRRVDTWPRLDQAVSTGAPVADSENVVAILLKAAHQRGWGDSKRLNQLPCRNDA